MNQTYRVVLADDHPLVLMGLTAVLQTFPGIEVAGRFENGDALLAALRAMQPDLALIDFYMPGRTGLEVLETLRRERIPTKLVLLSAMMNDRDVGAAIACGVDGILLKEAGPACLAACLDRVLKGESYFPDHFVKPALQREADRTARGAKLLAALTPREAEICLKVADGLSNKEVANTFGLAEGTVKLHLHNIFSKMNLRKRSELASIATDFREELVKLCGRPARYGAQA